MKYLFFSLSILVSTSLFGQSILNASSPEEFRKLRDSNKKYIGDSMLVQSMADPLPYGFIEEKDELWSKVTWEIIDLNEKLNQIYHHSSDGLISANFSLFDVLKTGVATGEIKEVYDDEFFKNKLDPAAAIGRLRNVAVDEFAVADMINNGIEPNQEDIDGVTDTIDIHSNDVEMVMIKGLWYIDKRLGEMKYRLLGVAMMGPDVKTKGKGIESGDELLPLFWIWYPDARKTLAKYRAFNSENNSARVSYDDLLNARRFNAVIYKTENGLGEGEIEEYLPADADAQLRESDRIKNRILELENQMWNY